MEEKNYLVYKKIFPKVENILNIRVKTIEEIKDNSLYVLDSNVLLGPYTTSKTSLETIKNIYKTLIKRHCLFIPGQVLREFAINRPEKIKNIFFDLTKKLDNNHNLFIEKYPLLEDDNYYRELLKIQEEITLKIEQHKKLLKKIKNTVKLWAWNDPISEIYRSLFDKNILFDPDLDDDFIKKEIEIREKYNIPPGFKDKSKNSNSSGDLIIWLTILKLVENKKQNIVFVSYEEKSDWFHCSEKQPLLPRYELQYEFQMINPNHSFSIIKFSELLELFGANKEVVEEIKFEEIKYNMSNFERIIWEAIKKKRLLALDYNGGIRIVEPHCLGITKADNIGLRAFQIEGYSESGNLGWKMFNIGNVSGLRILKRVFNEPRPGYRKGDRGMSQIYCEL